jgi:Homeodomain-like domain
MSRHRTDPLRLLSVNERKELTRLGRSLSAPAAQVERARALLAIAEGASYTAAAHQVGRRHHETISAWVSRVNRDGLAAVQPGHGGGARIRYGLTRSSVFWPNGRACHSASRTARPPGP